MLMFEKFTERARKVMSLSRQESQARNGSSINTEHALIAILREGGGVGAKVLGRLGITIANLIPTVDKIEPPSKDPSPLLGQIPFSPRMKRVIQLAGEEASRASNDVVGTEHLLLGLFLENEGIAARVLGQFDVTEERLRKEIREVIGDQADKVLSPLPKTQEIRINLYGPFEGGSTPKNFLVVNDVMYIKTGSILLAGITPDRYAAIARSVAGDMGCQVYTVELS
jgi:ATP-dependent Clp protease ATP-binding subunit ClpA